MLYDHDGMLIRRILLFSCSRGNSLTPSPFPVTFHILHTVKYDAHSRACSAVPSVQAKSQKILKCSPAPSMVNLKKKM